MKYAIDTMTQNPLEGWTRPLLEWPEAGDGRPGARHTTDRLGRRIEDTRQSRPRWLDIEGQHIGRGKETGRGLPSDNAALPGWSGPLCEGSEPRGVFLYHGRAGTPDARIRLCNASQTHADTTGGKTDPGSPGPLRKLEKVHHSSKAETSSSRGAPSWGRKQTRLEMQEHQKFGDL